jgi:hypothetical protein
MTGEGRIPYSTKIKAVWLMVLGTAPLTPQQTGDQSAGPVIRVTIDLVQVDAVVTDSKGRHVTGLKPEDFQILEDGKPQKITHFSYVPGNAIAGGPTPVNPEPRRPSGKNARSDSRSRQSAAAGRGLRRIRIRIRPSGQRLHWPRRPSH